MFYNVNNYAHDTQEISNNYSAHTFMSDIDVWNFGSGRSPMKRNMVIQTARPAWNDNER